MSFSDLIPSVETFWAVVGFLIVIAIFTAVINKRRKDRVLKMFDGYNISLQRSDGRVVWGLLDVFSQGLEILFVRRNSWGKKLKKSYLLHDHESGDILAIARWDGNITGRKIKKRFQQIKSRMKPKKWWLVWRCFCNWLNTFRDVFAKLFSLAVGQITKQRPAATIIGQESNEQIKKYKPQKYDPLLECKLGKLVVVELKVPSNGMQIVEFSGYLGEYSENYILLFNPDQAYETGMLISGDQQIEHVLHQSALFVTNPYDSPLVVEEINKEKLGIVVIPHCTARIQCGDQYSGFISKRESIDIILSRHYATVRHTLGISE
jgi:hypothetical protein